MQTVYLTKQLDPFTTQPFLDWVEECMLEIPARMRDVVVMNIRLEDGMGDCEQLQFAEWSYDPRDVVPIHKLQALLKEHPKFSTMVVQSSSLLPSGKGGEVLFFTGEHPYIQDELHGNQEWAYPPLVKWLKRRGWVFTRDHVGGTAPYIKPFLPSLID